MVTYLHHLSICLSICLSLYLSLTCLSADKMEDVDLDSADGLMSYGRNLQDESIKSLQRTVGVVGDTQQVSAMSSVPISLTLFI